MTGTLLDDQFLDLLHIPNIRNLMHKGVTFSNAYTSSPLCTPARGSFMTGQLPSRNGIYDNAAEFTSTRPTFAHYLRAVGYQTALSGKMHFVGADQHHGFEQRLTSDIYPADFGWTPDWEKPLERVDWWYHNLSSVTEAGIAEISNQLEFDDEVTYYAKLKLYQYARRVDTRPFCLCVSFTHPHDPYVTRKQYWDLYDHENIPMLQVAKIDYEDQDPHSKRLYDAVDHLNFNVREEDVRRARHAYFANISYLDDKIGEILSVLDQCDFAENTHILLCSDHGDMIGERGLWYKMSFFENSCRVPLVLRMASGENAGSQVSAPVANHDILPTLIDLAGEDIVLADEIDGSSLMPLLNQDDDSRTVYSEYCAEGSVAPMIMIRRGKYKFVYCPADPIQLFDLQADPLELENLAASETTQEIVGEFLDEMNQRWDFEKFTEEVKLSQRCRALVDKANRQGEFTAWDYQPQIDAKQRYMRNHLDLNILEANSRYPKPADSKN